MTQPDTDWDAAYRQAAPPPWSIGRPQPELERLIDEGKFRSDVLDSGCGHAALSLRLAALGHTVVGLDASATAIAEATAAAAAQGLTTATFARADVTDFADYPPGSEGRFATIVDSGLFHALPPQRRQDYLRSIFRAAAPGAALYILAFAAGALAPAHPTGRARRVSPKPSCAKRFRCSGTSTTCTRRGCTATTTRPGRRTARWPIWNTTARATSWRPDFW